jgi:hypothetical protein
MNTTITTLTGNTSLTTLVGTTNVTSTVGAINITAPIINSTGIWNHKGVMDVKGILQGSTVVQMLLKPVVLGAHQHTIGTSPANPLITIPPII